MATQFGERLRSFRKAQDKGKGWTQAQLAELAGVSLRAVIKIERGENEPNWTTAVALAKALGVRLDDFAEA